MYNIKEIKAIPIEDVARHYGIKLEKKHNRLWGKLRNEKDASFSINLEKNLWYDFGLGKGGSVIDFVAEIERITAKEAINKLAEMYNIENSVKKGWQPLTDSQYRELGVQPERATMNFNFDLNVHTPEQLQRWSEKYGMHVKDLAEKMPDVYNKLIFKVAMENIETLKNSYFTKIRLANDQTINEAQRQTHIEWAKADAKEINRKIDLLQLAIKNNVSLSNLKVDPEKDMSIFSAKEMSQDEAIRNKVVQVYERMFNMPQAKYLTIENAKAIETINRSVLDDKNKYLSFKELKDLYVMLGNKIQELNNEYNKYGVAIENMAKNQFDYDTIQHVAQDAENIYKNLSEVKKLFNLCSNAVDGFKSAYLQYKNDLAKQDVNAQEKIKNNSKEFVR
ncbi:MAG TPA: CHC2 zinc finger domain-containing protein [Sedimentibacter sp.]|nr:CHC2 zinc finger domain-containing protein [Defluviitaleaceae bacterium]HRC81209.1 CHC2 zinc finger domain-containing protein [Sedimentibacter sp.]